MVWFIWAFYIHFQQLRSYGDSTAIDTLAVKHWLHTWGVMMQWELGMG